MTIKTPLKVFLVVCGSPWMITTDKFRIHCVIILSVPERGKTKTNADTYNFCVDFNLMI